MKKILLFSLLTAFYLNACTSDKKGQEAAEIYNDAMKIHDEIMPQLDIMFTLNQKLKLRLDSLESDSIANAGRISAIRQGINDLTHADKEMMDWMHNIKDVDGGAGHTQHGGHADTTASTSVEESVKIQQEQKESILKVQLNMKNSIAAAEKLLKEKFFSGVQK